MLALSVSSLLAVATLASAYVRPAPRAEASPSVNPTCEAGTTTFSCPSGWYSADNPNYPVGDDTLVNRPYKSCGDQPVNTFSDSSMYCYYMMDQDYILWERQPDGTTPTDVYSDPSCPPQEAASVTCNPTTGSSYACTSPAVVFTCPAGYSASGTYTAGGSPNNGQDLICTSPSGSCYYYGDSGLVDTLSPDHISGGSCASQLVQSGTCTNALRRRNGKPTSPAWLVSRQAVVKKDSAANHMIKTRRSTRTARK